jgi:alpha-pyrone synthase
VVTHLITFSCTGMSAPGLDIQLVESLGLNRNVERTCINFMGCYAGINALKVAYHIARSQPESIVLLAGVELCTLHYQKNDKQDQLVANALFADGAAACLVSSKEISSIDEKARLVIQNFYSEFEPAGKDEMIWTIGDTGFDLRLSTEVPELIRKNISALIAKLMKDSSLKNNQIDFYAIHPGGMKILEACENALGISKKQNQISYDVLSNYGNMSSVTIFFVLKEYLNSFLRSDDGKKILACAFGPGLTMESMIAEVCFSH